jgi:hypothetical protein
MDSLDDWQRAKYDDVFEQICRYVRQRRATDPRFTIDALARLLETQYHHEGNQPAIKGEIQQITEAATIAAFEYVLAQWQHEEDTSTDRPETR